MLDNPPESNLDWSGETPDPATSRAPWRIFNIGNSEPVELAACICVLEKSLGIKAEKNLLPKRRGEVDHTYADVTALKGAVNYQPQTRLAEGIDRFVCWYRDYYAI